MPTLLLEIGCEELPAGACYEAEAQLPELVRAHLGVEPTKLYVGPRRLAVRVDDLPERTPDTSVKGPPEARREQAAAGFARKHGLLEEELEVRDGFLWARVPGEELRGEVLLDRMRHVVHGLAFTKSMRWDESGHRFARPIRWACEKLDEETLWGDGTTFGRRFFAGEVEVRRAQEYEETLRSAGVEPDAAERERMIREGLDALGEWSDPAGVLREVIHLVEWPFVLEGRFDERYLSLPERVIQAPMQADQRYFPLGGNRFGIVANGGAPDIVRAGHENVLESRLEDASFTFERDVKKGIDGLAGELAAITFFAGAGSFADKAERLVGLVDPLGLRRDAIGLCRLAVEGSLTIPRELLEGDVRDFVEERLEGLLDVPVEFVRAARGSSGSHLGAVAEPGRGLA